MAKQKSGCIYKGVQYDVDDTICKDGLLAVCGPDGIWQVSAETCSENLSDSATSKGLVQANLRVEDPSSASIKSTQFPAAIVTAAQNAQGRTKCLPSVILALWAIMSEYGKNHLCVNNPFGMKWYEGCKYGYVQLPLWDHSQNKASIAMTKLVSFPSVEEAFEVTAQLLMEPQGPYSKALPFKDDWKKFIEAIAKASDASPAFAEAMITIVESNDLTRFDQH